MTWRIYRLPGSRENWHIDSGCGTQVFNVRFWQAAESRSRDVCGNHVPRSWVEISAQELHIVNGVAYFEYPGVVEAVRETLAGLS